MCGVRVRRVLQSRGLGSGVLQFLGLRSGTAPMFGVRVRECSNVWGLGQGVFTCLG